MSPSGVTNKVFITEAETDGKRQYDVLIVGDEPSISQTTKLILDFLQKFIAGTSFKWEYHKHEGKCHPNANAFSFVHTSTAILGGKVKEMVGCDLLTGIHLKSFHHALLWTMKFNGWIHVVCDESQERQWSFEKNIDLSRSGHK